MSYLASLGPAKFNCSAGESMEFFYKDWILYGELFSKLEEIKDNSLWGDIYVKYDF